MTDINALIEQIVSATSQIRNEFFLLQGENHASRKECEEQARLNGMGSQREARLLAELAEEKRKREAEHLAALEDIAEHIARASAAREVAIGNTDFATVERVDAEIEAKMKENASRTTV